MRLNSKQFVKIATSAQDFALLNKTELNNKRLYVYFGEDNITPPYNETIFVDAFVINSNKDPMSIQRGNIPGAVYVAPVDSYVDIALKVWTD